MKVLDAKRHKPLEGGASFSLANRLFRVVWMLSWTLLARWTPPPLHGWRRFLLRLFGAQVGRGVRLYGSTRVWYPPNLCLGDHVLLGPGVHCYNQGRISIGARTVVSQGAHLCASSHDIADPDFQLILKPIMIGAGAWVAAEAFVGPGCHIGDGAVIGARAALFRNAEPWAVYSGNPAQFLKPRPLGPQNEGTMHGKV
jgi:putative colanic acid biosynthesis acetyltransferase WcaF